jgi:hypothetical protein
MSWRSCLAGALLLSAPLSQGVHAQTVEGTVRDRTTSRPIRGAFVVLLDSGGVRRRGALTDSAGHFALDAPAPGTYRVRAEMIGYGDAVPQPLQLLPLQTVPAHFLLTPQAIALEGIDVRAAPRCHMRSDQAGVELAIWSEARKGLSLADWSARESGLVMVTRRSEGYNGWPLHVLGVDTIQGRQPFVTLEPATIRASGLIYRDGEAFVFYGPGPEYILGDDFVATHCFATRLRKDAVGLAFVPVQPARPGDIEGTLWLDRRTWSLQRLEFEYVRLDPRMHVPRAHGALQFDRTPRGLWLIRAWEITFRLTSGHIKETRGDVIASWMPAAPGTMAPSRTGS